MQQKLEISIKINGLINTDYQFFGFCSTLIKPSCYKSIFKKHCFNLSLPILKQYAPIFFRGLARIRCLFHDGISLASFFTCQGNQYMSNKKVIELQLGEKFQFSESSSMIVHSIKDNETVRLAFNAPKHVKIFTERTYKRILKEFYWARGMKKGETDPC